jgi:hypothetical protein
VESVRSFICKRAAATRRRGNRGESVAVSGISILLTVMKFRNGEVRCIYNTNKLNKRGLEFHLVNKLNWPSTVPAVLKN